MTKKLITILLFLIISESAYAEDKAKISIAIMEFRANNTKEGFGKACMDILSEELFASELFTLMEKSQMDKIARLNGFKEFNIIDPQQIAKFGKILNVDKMIVGSITYLDTYIIDVKILNAVTGEIEFNVRKKISSIDKLENSLDDIALSIERHCQGYYNLSGNFDISVEMVYLKPFGTFSNAVDPGPGIQAVIAVNPPPVIPFDMQIITGYYNFKPVYESINYFYMFPLYLTAAYKFTLTRNLNFMPSAGFGYIFSKISSDKSEETDSIYWQEKSLYYNPAIVIRTELDILLFDRWYLVFTPQYNVFFEEERVGQFASFGLGLKMLF
ncbi:MAG TPA: CsgG/HfaB family protein [Spirochaetota bacterium]|nr:CsgG/HfaB family protein [Spirochaetota bacterium]HPS88236.1 CsgG/HfaB family protein [Spirochaetota bacterium]